MKKNLLLLLLVLSFGLMAKAQVIEDFETWNTYPAGLFLPVQLTEPVGWSSTDSLIVSAGKTFNALGTFQAQIFQDNPGYTGSGAMRVAVKFQDDINAMGIINLPAKDYPGVCTNALIGIDFTSGTFNLLGGTPMLIRPTFTSMWVKNTVVGGDSTFITAVLIDDSDGGDSILATADTILTANIGAFTKITLPFNYNASTLDPTIVRYTITAANPLGLLDSTNTFSVHSGTEIVIDDIDVAWPTGVKHVINSKSIAKVYPTMGSDIIHIDIIENMNDVHFDIYQLNGQLVETTRLQALNNIISLNGLAAGTYVYALKSQGVIYQSGKFIR